jgi:hypothetical protein
MSGLSVLLIEESREGVKQSFIGCRIKSKLFTHYFFKAEA